MRWLISAILALVVQAIWVSAAPNALAQSETEKLAGPPPRNVVAVVPRSWPPQYDVDKDEKPIGFAIDVMNEIAARAGLTVTYIIAENFAAADRMLKRGDADLIPNSGILPERLAEFSFTGPVETFSVSLFVRTETNDINGVADLVGRKLAVVETNIGQFMFGNRRDIEVQVYRDVRTALFELLAGRADALVYPEPVIWAITRPMGIDHRFKVVGASLREVKRGIRVRKDSVALLALLNGAVDGFVGTPAYLRIYKKWYAAPEPYWTVPRILWTMGGLLVAMLMVMALWRYWSVVSLNRELKLSISKRERAEEARRESDQRFRRIFEDGPLGMGITNPDGHLMEVNDTFCRMVGYTADELKQFSFADITHPDDIDANIDLQGQVFRGETDHFQIEKRYVRKTGDSVWANLTASVIRDDQGAPAYGLGMVEDITARKRAEQTLRQAQKMEAVGQLTGGVAHEFNNLLAVIIGNLEFAQEKNREGQEVDRFVEQAMAAADKGAALTQRLLAFSRKQSLRPRAIDLNALMPNLLDLLRPALGEPIEVKIDLAGDVWSPFADPEQFETTILTLAVNSRAAMPGGGRLTIEAANVRLGGDDLAEDAELEPGDYVLLSVTDTGVGMPPKVLEHAFEPFYTTKEVGEGTGLGLSMVHGFVRQSGGHVEIASEVGGGTTVKIYLPRSTEASAQSDGEPAVEPEYRGKGETILVVEDEPAVRELFVRMLTDLGYQIVEAGDGKAALQVLDETPGISLLFTDVVLPKGMSGGELAREAQRRWPGIKVLHTSGYTDDSIAHHGKIDEGVDLLRKPYGKSILARKVREVLDRRE